MSTAPTAVAEVADDIRSLADLTDDPCPAPGQWEDEDYLKLTDHINRLVEFTDGFVELLPMPSREHQNILGWLFEAFRHHIAGSGGTVAFAPMRLRIREGKFREPDLLFSRDANDPHLGSRYNEGADIVLEVVSPGGAKRDLVDKRSDYAEAKIPEYWIVDPRTETVTVLRLADGEYTEAGVFSRGTNATSCLVPDLACPVDELFDAASGY